MWGRHLILDCSACDREAVRDAGTIRRFCEDVFDTVGLLGGAIAVQAPQDRLGFATGASAASWVWFVMIGSGASALRARLTSPVRLWTQRGSGALTLVFAGFLALRLA